MIPRLPRSEWLGHGAMLLYAILVAGSFSLGGLSANLIDPVAISAARFVLAACMISALSILGPGITRKDFAAPWRFLLTGFAMATYFVAMFEGLKTATPVSTAAVFTLTPILSGIFGWLLLRQITTAMTAFWLSIGAIGAVWVIFRADFAALMRFDIGKGEIIFFGGCVAIAIFTPLMRRLNRGEHPLVFTMGTLIAGSLVLSLWGARALIETDWSKLPTTVWITLFYLTVFATAGTFFLIQFATLRLPASKVMAYTYLTPAVVILWEGALGHGWPMAVVLVGVGLIISALLGLLRS